MDPDHHRMKHNTLEFLSTRVLINTLDLPTNNASGLQFDFQQLQIVIIIIP